MILLLKLLTQKPATHAQVNYVLQAPVYNNAIYQWYRNDSLIYNATEAVYTVSDNAAGDYTVNVSLPGICYHSFLTRLIFLPYAIML